MVEHEANPEAWSRLTGLKLRSTRSVRLTSAAPGAFRFDFPWSEGYRLRASKTREVA